MAQRIAAFQPRVIGLHARNSIDWIVADLAALTLGIPAVPLPDFFSTGQLRHVFAASSIDVVLTDAVESLEGVGKLAGPCKCIGGLTAWRVVSAGPRQTTGARWTKLTFTSGSSGQPKGVRLSTQIVQVAKAAALASGIESHDRHLTTMPLSVLLENVGGVYRTLLAGATIVVAIPEEVGAGQPFVDGARLASELKRSRATTCILTPASAGALVTHVLEHPADLPGRLDFVGVGGAPVPRAILDGAKSMNLPLFEGYGLSEAGSVVSLNRPGQHRIGSVGKPLRGIRTWVDTDGQLWVGAEAFAGYVGEDENAAPSTEGLLPTGDLVRVDEGGFLHVIGRRKEIFITSDGRNVSPAWIELMLVGRRGIRQAAVLGEGREFPIAVLTVDHHMNVDQVVDHVNRQLPPYARLGAWVPSREVFKRANGTLTPKGTPDRDRVEELHRPALELIWRGMATHVEGRRP